MEIKQTAVFDVKDPISKALNEVLKTGIGVIITKEGKYYGMIDDRHIEMNIKNPSKVLCETEAIKPPVLSPDIELEDAIESFLLGHYKSLPVVDEKTRKPLGVVTRADVIAEMLKERMVPKLSVDEVMNSPVYTIDEKETIGAARRKMKEHDTHRLVVTRNGRPIGILSTFDLSIWAVKPKGMPGKREYAVNETIRVDDYPISDYFRPYLVKVKTGTSLLDAAREMAEKEISSLLVVDDNDKPAGVIVAMDIFKLVKRMMEAEEEIAISGLNEDTIIYYNTIKEKLEHVIDKFKESLDIKNIRAHVKETKSVYSLNVHLSTSEGNVVVSRESGDLKQVVDWVAVDLERVLSKKKQLRDRRYKGKS